jgi:hypothetical protein
MMSSTEAELAFRDAELDNRYRRLLHHYDSEAVRYKRRLLTFWGLSMGLTWVPLLLAIAALSGWLPSGFSCTLSEVILPGAGLANSLVTVAQLIFMFRGRWLKYRAATERLRENCMRFRARLRPFGRDNAEESFRVALVELEKELGERRPLRWQDWIPWSYLIGLRTLPENIRQELAHTPDEGLYPRCGDDLDAAETLLILERLRHQQRWHVIKAGQYSRRYLALQAGVVLLGLANAAYGWFVGHELGQMALFSTATLFLIAYREQMAYAPLCLRYTRIADTLAQIEADYRAQLAHSPELAPEQRALWLQNAAARVEQALASEFQYWYFGIKNIGSAASN